MKIIILICLTILSMHGFDQKVALLDKKLKQPIIFTDSVTVEQINRGYIPVEVKDLDTFYANITYVDTCYQKLRGLK